MLSNVLTIGEELDPTYPRVENRTGRQRQRIIAQNDGHRIQPRIDLHGGVVLQHKVVGLGGAAIVRHQRIESKVAERGGWQ